MMSASNAIKSPRSQTWHELESDPGLFTLLLEDIGAQVEEIYDLQQKIDSHVPIASNIHTTKATRSRGCSNPGEIHNSNNDTAHQNQPDWTFVTDDNIVKSIFFVRQFITNSCATHALLSILMNCGQHKELDLGDILKKLKDTTVELSPENKGCAIGSLPELAKAHNAHASYISRYNRRSLASCSRVTGNQRTMLQQSNKHDTFHFVSFVPINNHLFELDGLQNYPIDHGPIGEHENWTEKFRQVITSRLWQKSCNGYAGDIRYNLMAVVPDKRVELSSRIACLKENQKLVVQAIDELTRRFQSPLTVDTERSSSASPQLGSLCSSGTDTASEASSAFNSPTVATPRDTTPDDTKLSMTSSHQQSSNSTSDTQHRRDSDVVGQHPSKNAISNLTDSNSINEPSSKIVNEIASKNLKLSLPDLVKLSRRIEHDIEINEQNLREEQEKRRKYKIDDSRRVHNYEPFIVTFLYMLAQKGQLTDLIEKDLGIVTTTTPLKAATTTMTVSKLHNYCSNDTNYMDDEVTVLVELAVTCLLVSILSLIVLSYDRLISIIKPFWKRFGVRRAMIANFAIWIVSMLMASPLIFSRELIRRQWRDIEEVWCNEDVQYSKYYWLIITAFLIYLPMASMTIVFCVILAQMDKFDAKLRRSSISTLHNPAVASIKISYRRKIIKVLIIYLLTTTICWTSLQVTVFYRHFRKEDQLPSWFQEAVFFSQTFASLSSAINPIIFGILSEPFRKALSTSRLFKFAKKFNGVDCGGLQVQRTKQNSEDPRQLSASKRSDNIPKTSPDSRQKRSSNQTLVTKGNLNAEKTPSPKARQQSLSREQNQSPPDTNTGLDRLGVTFARTISRRGLKNVAPNHSDENRAITSHGRQNFELSPPKQRKMRCFSKKCPN
ncbi:Ubiquitin carboxyl-terminal hydrolase calypso [Fragariocoptes setiger]|uniref:ubiquitinyl hydrolase 1 n=1 Tax=Fragariocoptes setiger TaxID=1670756 RepID=A0ABQ7S7Q1_9ACAR|nr:Ubiquitin carboxyl-terminal hydrolase calypso [Fragariocoptes setiger]